MLRDYIGYGEFFYTKAAKISINPVLARVIGYPLLICFFLWVPGKLNAARGGLPTEEMQLRPLSYTNILIRSAVLRDSAENEIRDIKDY